ncbi:DUF3039 domain-containing protein [Aeromicrobium piscarium]|uniref:DUF3039 domain-containing protein n=1 Tax=Aeromicrobium piscarium TaxID=2590901 RepID=A0A554S8Y6_9ACTN|nr:DUF3039 domain-containing protein [Aeromicrobium piscarium]
MSAATVTQRTTSATKRKKVHHYYPKDDILRSVVDGVKIMALCGARGRIVADPVGTGQGGTPNTCPRCAERYELLRS